jgi:hypothetical protein
LIEHDGSVACRIVGCAWETLVEGLTVATGTAIERNLIGISRVDIGGGGEWNVFDYRPTRLVPISAAVNASDGGIFNECPYCFVGNDRVQPADESAKGRSVRKVDRGSDTRC